MHSINGPRVLIAGAFAVLFLRALGACVGDDPTLGSSGGSSGDGGSSSEVAWDGAYGDVATGTAGGIARGERPET